MSLRTSRLRARLRPLGRILILLSVVVGSLSLVTEAQANGLSISGTVVAADGSAIQGATVKVFNIGTIGALTLVETVTTGSSGTFSVPVGDNCFYVVVASKPIEASLADAMSVVPVFGSSIMGQYLTLNSWNIKGSVVHENQSIAPNSVVTATAISGPNNFDDSKVGTSGLVPDMPPSVFVRNDGTYRLHVPVGSYSVKASPSHDNPFGESPSLATPVSVTPESGAQGSAQDVNFVLRIPTVFGTLVNEATNQPIPLTYVSFTGSNGDFVETTTGLDGTFSVAGSAGEYDVRSYISDMSPFDIVTDWTNKWVYAASSSPSNRLLFKVKTPNFRGTITTEGNDSPLRGSSIQIESKSEGGFVRGSMGDNGRFGYYLAPGDYLAIAVAPYVNPLGLGSSVKRFTVTEDGPTLTQRFALPSVGAPPYAMSRYGASVTKLCNNSNMNMHRDERVLGMSGDGTKTLVDTCELGTQSPDHTVVLLNETGAVVAEFSNATDTATISSDGSTIAWTKTVDDINKPAHTLSVAVAPSWNVVTTELALPDRPYGNYEVALSPRGDKILTSIEGADDRRALAVCPIEDDASIDCVGRPMISIGQMNPHDLRLSSSGDTVLFRSDVGRGSSKAMIYELSESEWEETVSEDSADVAPAMSDDGKTVIWLNRDGASVGMRQRGSELVAWGEKSRREPIDTERLDGTGAISALYLSRDGSTAFLVAEVNDLAYLVSAGSSFELRRFFTPQLWSYKVNGELSSRAQMVSIQSDSKRPLEGMSGYFGDINSVAISSDGTSFVLTADVSVEDSYMTKKRLFRGVDASNFVYEFDDSAEIVAVVGSQMMSLSWPAASGKGVRYVVSRSPAGGSSALTTTKTSALLNGLVANTTYTVTVKAIKPDDSIGDTLTKVVATTAARSRALRSTVSAGGSVDFAWEAEPLGTNCEVRVIPTNNQLSAVTLSASGTTVSASGLASGSHWKARAWCLIDGIATAITDEGDVEIPTMLIDSVTWSAPMSGRLVSLNGTLTVSMSAESGRSGSAVVRRTKTNGSTTNTQISLVESSAGSYTGTLSIVDTASIDEVTGQLSDGDSNSVTRLSNLPKTNIEGVVNVTIAGPARKNWQLVLSSLNGSLVRLQALPKAGPQVVSFTGVKQTKDVQVTLRSTSGLVVSTSSLAEVNAGVESFASLPARALVDVSLVVTSGDDDPVAGMRIDATDGEKFWQLITDAAGLVMIPSVASGKVITVKVWPNDPFATTVQNPEPIAIGEADVTVPVQVVERAKTIIRGKLRSRLGYPVSFASVTVTQRNGELTKTLVGLADSKGDYSITGAFAGLDTEVSVSPAQATPARESLVSVPTSTVVDFELDVPLVYMVPVKLFPSDATTPLSLDWRTAVHFRMSAAVGGRTISTTSLAELPDGVQGGVMAVRGNPGEKLKACFDGVEGGDGKACGTITLPVLEDPIPNLEVKLPPIYTVNASVHNSDGSPYEGRLTVIVKPDDGSEIIGWQSVMSGPNLAVPVESTGRFKISVQPAYDSSGFSASASLEVTLASERILTLQSPLVLSRPSRFSSAENIVTADRPTVSPGSTVDFRVSWKNDGTALSNAIARVVIPLGTQLSTASLMLGTRPLPVDRVTLLGSVEAGQTAVVELGNIAAGATGSLRWRLRLSSEIRSLAIAGSISIGSGTEFDPLPAVIVPVTGVKLLAPGSPTGSAFSVRGRAPVDSKIEVMYDGAVVGRTTTSSIGTFVVDVTLPQRPDGTVYSLVARAALGATTFESEPSLVKINSLSVKTTFICVRQQDPGRADGRRFCFDSALGVAAFPFVFVPGQMLQVEVFTDAPSRVDKVRVWIGGVMVEAEKRVIVVAPGSGLSLDAKRDAFVADFPSVMARGEISIQLISRPAMPIVPPLPEPEEAVKYVPADLLTAMPSAPTVVSENERGGTFTQSLDVPSMAGEKDVNFEATFLGSNAEPTGGQIATMKSEGSLIWGLTAGDLLKEDLPGGGKKFSRSVSFKMLTENIPNLSQIKATSKGTVHGQNALVSALLKKAASVGLTQEVRFNISTNSEAAFSAWGGGKKYEDASDLMALIGDCVSNSERARLVSRSNALVDGAMAFDALNTSIALGSLAVAPATFGTATVALWAAGFALGKATDFMLDESTNKLRTDIELANTAASASPDCRKKPPRDPKAPEGSPVAKPGWIYDPSGYTYEGIAENRISGVIATLLGAPDVPEGEECPEVATWQVVDMSPYDQVNPLMTDEDGRYAWDVPEGCWKVQFSKAGYHPAYSAALKVLPPRLDVNVPLVRITDPSVISAQRNPDGTIDVIFDRLMSVNQTIESISMLNQSNGSEVSATVTAISPSPSPFGRQLSAKYNIVPAIGLAPGGTYRVLVMTDAVDYADRALAVEVHFDVNVPTTPETSTTTTVEPTPSSTLPPPPNSPTTVTPSTPTTAAPVLSNVFKVNKNVSRTSVLRLAKITAPSGSKVMMSVLSSSSKNCKISGTNVKMVKPGTCKVAVTMTPKKGKAIKKTVTLKVVK